MGDSEGAPQTPGRRGEREAGTSSPSTPTGSGERDDGASKDFWHRPQAVVAVVGGSIGAVAAVAGLAFLLFPDAKPEPRAPDVELVDFDVEREKNIQAEVLNVATEERKRITTRSSLVTVTLRNKSSDPVFIKHADLHFKSATEVGCNMGGGPTQVKAEYKVKIPYDKQRDFDMRLKMKYTLPPHGQERIAFTVGPEAASEGSLPRAYVFKTSLHMDSGKSLATPYVAYLAPHSRAEAFLANAELAMDGTLSLITPECVMEEAASAEKLVDNSRYPAPELKEFSRKLSEIAQGR